MLLGKRPDIGEMGIGDELQLGGGLVRRPVGPNLLHQSGVGAARDRVFLRAAHRIEPRCTGHVARADELFPRPSQRRISLVGGAVRALAAVDHYTVSGRLGPPFAMLRSSAGNWPSGAPSTPSSTPVIVSHRHVTTHLTSGRLLWPPRASPTRSARSALFRSRNEARAADAGREAVARGLGFRKRSARSRDGSELHEQAQHVGRRPALDHPPVSEVQHRLPGHREAGTGRRDPHEHAVVGAALGEP